jgi:maltose/moltooligosaccharide transporter
VSGKLPWRRTFLLGFGFFGITLLWPIYDSFVPIFLSGFGLSNRAIGFWMTLDNYANLFIQLWVGNRSDRTRTRWGRRFPYILLGAPFAALGGALIPLGAMQSLPLLIGAMLLMTISMSLFRSPTVALLGDVFPPELRSRANGVINFMGLLAGVLAFLVGGVLYRINPAYPFWVAAAVMILVLGLLVTRVKEPPLPAPARSAEEQQTSGVLASLQRLAQDEDRSALYLLFALLAWSVGITALQAFFTLFSREELGVAEGAAAQLLSFYPLAGLLFAIPGGYLGTYLGRKRVILLCLATMAAGLVIFLLIPPAALGTARDFNLLDPTTWFRSPTVRLLIVLLLAAGASLTVITVNVLPMLLDMAPEGQMGSFTGLYYLFGSLASILGPPLGGLLVDLTGSYRAIFVFAPFWVVLGLALMWRVREPQRPILKLTRFGGLKDKTE